MGQNMKKISPDLQLCPPVLRMHSSQDAFRGLLEYFKALAGSVERELLKVPLSHQVNSADACFSVGLEAALFVLTEVGEVRDAWRGGGEHVLSSLQRKKNKPHLGEGNYVAKGKLT